MRFVFRLLLFLPWLAAAFAFWWSRERYHRGGPCPFSQAWVLHLPIRRLTEPPERMLEGSHVRPGATVLELGPGTGYFSAEAARMVGARGRLICVDVQPEMAHALERRLDSMGIGNAGVLVGEAGALPVADGSVDSAFLAYVLGEIPDRVSALRELRRVLAPGGILSVTEMLFDPDYQFMASVRDLARASGFEELEEIRRFPGYTLNFRAPISKKSR